MPGVSLAELAVREVWWDVISNTPELQAVRWNDTVQADGEGLSFNLHLPVLDGNEQEYVASDPVHVEVEQFIFWEVTSKPLAIVGGRVTGVSAPCIVSITFNTSTGVITVTVSSPLPTVKSVDVNVVGQWKGNGCTLKQEKGDGTLLHFELPTGDFNGKSMTITCTPNEL
jgi:hypothetical protein